VRLVFEIQQLAATPEKINKFAFFENQFFAQFKFQKQSPKLD
jgi:hypothetical protein